MSGTTISGTYLTGITISNAAAQNPATIAAGATITTSGTALAGAAGTYWTVVNDGAVSGAIGISLASSGDVTNDASVTGTTYGVVLGTGGQNTVGAITNAASASISGNQIGIKDAGNDFGTVTVVNSGSIAGYRAVSLKTGQVTNASGAQIQGTDLGVYLRAGNVVNSGTIHGGAQGPFRDGVFVGQAGAYFTNNVSGVVDGNAFGVQLFSGGTAFNAGTISGGVSGLSNGEGDVPDSGGDTLLTNAASGLIESSSTIGSGVVFYASGSIINSGTIQGGQTFSGQGIVLKAGGYIDNAVGATISGYDAGVYATGGGAVVNYGAISSAVPSDRHVGVGVGLSLGAGGFVTNAAGGSISGDRYGIESVGGNGAVYNSGLIQNGNTTTGAGVYLKAGGSVTNSGPGSIAGTNYGVDIVGAGAVTNSGSIMGGLRGAFITGSGHVTNAAGGSIEGGLIGVDLAARGTLINAGTITGTNVTSGTGAYLSAGGVVTNSASGSITGNRFGIEILGNTGTVLNAGTIASYNSDKLEASPSGLVFTYVPVPSGIYLQKGGSITNAASAVVTGQFGIYANTSYTANSSLTVVNSGTILGVGKYVHRAGFPPGYAIYAKFGHASITNTASALIAGGSAGINAATATITNAGTITGLVAIGVGNGSIYNKIGGVIQGYLGVHFYNGTQNVPDAITNAGTIIGAVQDIYGSTTIVNSGTISSHGTEGIYLSSASILNTASGLIESDSDTIDIRVGGTVTNAGTITSGNGAAIRFSGSASSAVVIDPGAAFVGKVVGSLNASNTLELASGASTGTISGLGTSFVNFGSVLVDSHAAWKLTGSNDLAAGSTLTNSGTLALSGATLVDGGRVINDGQIELDPSTMNVAAVSGTGTMTIDAGSTLTVQGVVGSGQDIVFSGSGGELDLPKPLDFGATLTGFTNGDIIDLTSVINVDGSSADMDYTTNLLTVTEGSATYQFQFDQHESFAGDFFHLVSHTGTVIEENQIACYRRGTLIATAHGEVPVEALAIGDEVVTASGAPRPIKWIGRRSYHGRFIVGRKDILPICFKAGSIDDGVPRRDLWISPHHAMYFYVDVFGGLLIEARDLLNGTSIVQIDQAEQIDYFHIELDSHDVILAEGALSETFVDDDSRGMFHNADEHALLYPETADEATRYCAPRAGDGFGLETVRQRLALRAGLISTTPQSGRLRGYVDLISACSIEGWAQNPDHPEAPVCLDICADGRLIGQTLANQYREDLEKAGLGSGRHAFVFQPLAGMLSSPAAIEVRRSFDGAVLGRSAAPKSAPKSALVA